ncbi:MAG: hypothetical protein JWR23_1101 [Mucilaginibacter sp.]|nr:hypothetical protein [Mucilaginibacter sp.]
MTLQILQKNRFRLLKRASVMLMALMAAGIQLRAQKSHVNTQKVDAATWDNKIMAGYQGWFRNPGDNPKNINQGWSHLFSGNGANGTIMRPGFDMWPDMSEYTSDEKTAVPGYTNPDGSQAYLYSAQNAKAVMRHFQWMKKYGVDGVWVSEFCDHFPLGRQQSDSTTVYTIMHNVQAAAKATGRTWAFMWDMSGFTSRNPATLISKEDVYKIIITNWKKMVDEGVTSTSGCYMHQNGKPVLQIWGFFPDRPASQPDYMNAVIDFLQAPGKYQAVILAGVDDKWRTKGTPEFVNMLMRMPGLQPWSVGRATVDAATGYKVPNSINSWAADITMCKAHGVVFQPTINSGTNIAGPPPPPGKLPSVPRRSGNYLWAQFVAAQKTGVINSAFICMFDEINEGTQIMKTTNHPPTQYPFLTFDGATSDFYLRLVGTASMMLKNHIPITPVIPISLFDTKKWYRIQNKASSLMLTNQSKTAKTPLVQTADEKSTGGEWQLVYVADDGNSYYKIKSRLSGKVLSRAADDSIIQTPDVKSDYSKWHFEWDGTGYCRIINKVSGKALSNDNLTTASAPVIQVKDPTKPADLKSRDDLRWKIIEE